MRIEPSNPFHISRAYGVQPPATAARVEAPAATASHASEPGAVSRGGAGAGAAKLVAGVVPGRIDFSGDAPTQNTSAIAMYRHPADRNAAATGVNAGRLIDIKG